MNEIHAYEGPLADAIHDPSDDSDGAEQVIIDAIQYILDIAERGSSSGDVRETMEDVTMELSNVSLNFTPYDSARVKTFIEDTRKQIPLHRLLKISTSYCIDVDDELSLYEKETVQSSELERIIKDTRDEIPINFSRLAASILTSVLEEMEDEK